VLDDNPVVLALAIAFFARQGWRARHRFGAHRIAQA
jgi:hypothetical protein